jgi:hypothetical protein
MRKKEIKKLALKSETVRRLQPVAPGDLAQVNGGGAEGCRRTAYCNGEKSN